MNDGIAVTPVQPGMAYIEAAHASVNAAFNAIAVDRAPAAPPAPKDVDLARDYVTEARQAIIGLAGHDGPDDAALAARAVLPRLDRAMAILDELGQSRDPLLVQPLLDELGIAMDHAEAALGAVGWD